MHRNDFAQRVISLGRGQVLALLEFLSKEVEDLMDLLPTEEERKAAVYLMHFAAGKHPLPDMTTEEAVQTLLKFLSRTKQVELEKK